MPRLTLPRSIKRAICISSVFLFVTMTCSLMISLANTNGNLSQLAVGFVARYPYIAIKQILSLSMSVFILVFFAIWVFECIIFGLRGPNKQQKTVFNLGYGCLYLLLIFFTLYKYPALFENYLPGELNQFVFKTAFNINLAYYQFAYGLIFFLLAFFAKKKRIFIVFLLGLFSTQSSFDRQMPNFLKQAKQESKQNNKPSILIIAVDSLRTDRIADPRLTPSINKLKDDPQAVVFADHFVGIPRTFPSWVELLQGNYAGFTNIRHMFPNLNDSGNLQDDVVMNAQKNAYRTAVFSDFAGDIFPRFKTGFESVHTPNMTISDIIGMGIAQSALLWLPILLAPGINDFFPYLKENPSFADPSELSSKAISWINKEVNRKFFAAIFFSTAHFPYASPWPWYTKYSKPDYTGPYYFSKTPKLNESENSLRHTDITQVRSLYNGAISAVDHSIGELLDELKANGSYDNSLIILTADHGEDLYENGNIQGHGEHLKGKHVLNVPLIIKLPKSLQRKQPTIDFVTRAIDLAPTIKSLSYQKSPVAANAENYTNKDFQGIDLSPWIIEYNNEQQHIPAPDLTAYSETGIWFSREGNVHFQQSRIDYPNINELLEFDNIASGQITLKQQYENTIITAKHRSVIWQDLKLIYMPTSNGIQYQLYFRKSDPYNLTDLSNDYPDLTAKMKTKLFNVVAKIEPPKRIVQGFVIP